MEPALIGNRAADNDDLRQSAEQVDQGIGVPFIDMLDELE